MRSEKCLILETNVQQKKFQNNFNDLHSKIEIRKTKKNYENRNIPRNEEPKHSQQ